MANNCIDWIQVYGSDLTKTQELINEAIKRNEEGYGWLPEGFEQRDGYIHYLFDLDDVHKEDDGISFVCWTKWSPPIEELKGLSKLCKGTEWMCQYEETGMQLYGRLVIKDGEVVSHIFIDDNDMKRIEEDAESNVYFDGELVDSEIVAIEEMLDEKEMGIRYNKLKTEGSVSNAEEK